jgi:hypothetical protein
MLNRVYTLPRAWIPIDIGMVNNIYHFTVDSIVGLGRKCEGDFDGGFKLRAE